MCAREESEGGKKGEMASSAFFHFIVCSIFNTISKQAGGVCNVDDRKGIKMQIMI